MKTNKIKKRIRAVKNRFLLDISLNFNNIIIRLLCKISCKPLEKIKKNNSKKKKKTEIETLLYTHDAITSAEQK